MPDARARIDPGSATWAALKEWAEEQIKICRTLLEGDQPEMNAASTRGRIKQLRDLLTLADPLPPGPKIGSQT